MMLSNVEQDLRVRVVETSHSPSSGPSVTLLENVRQPKLDALIGKVHAKQSNYFRSFARPSYPPQ